jgi:hypothetical protein
MTEPLRLPFTVDCPVPRAFAVWTGRISMWWPADHTVTGEPGLEVVLEPRVGGRIFERTPAGAEYGSVCGATTPRSTRRGRRSG